jgi:hypothetical protein
MLFDKSKHYDIIMNFDPGDDNSLSESPPPKSTLLLYKKIDNFSSNSYDLYTTHSSNLESRAQHIDEFIRALEKTRYYSSDKISQRIKVLRAWKADIMSELWASKIHEREKNNEFVKSYTQRCKQFFEKNYKSVLFGNIEDSVTIITLAHKLDYLIRYNHTLDHSLIFDKNARLFTESGITDWYNDYTLNTSTIPLSWDPDPSTSPNDYYTSGTSNLSSSSSDYLGESPPSPSTFANLDDVEIFRHD